MDISDSATDPSAATAAGAQNEPPADSARVDGVLVAVFWVWAVLLAVATLAQLFGWDPVLDVLDVKRWF